MGLYGCFLWESKRFFLGYCFLVRTGVCFLGAETQLCLVSAEAESFLVSRPGLTSCSSFAIENQILERWFLSGNVLTSLEC